MGCLQPHYQCTANADLNVVTPWELLLFCNPTVTCLLLHPHHCYCDRNVTLSHCCKIGTTVAPSSLLHPHIVAQLHPRIVAPSHCGTAGTLVIESLHIFAPVVPRAQSNRPHVQQTICRAIRQRARYQRLTPQAPQMKQSGWKALPSQLTPATHRQAHQMPGCACTECQYDCYCTLTTVATLL